MPAGRSFIDVGAYQIGGHYGLVRGGVVSVRDARTVPVLHVGVGGAQRARKDPNAGMVSVDVTGRTRELDGAEVYDAHRRLIVNPVVQAVREPLVSINPTEGLAAVPVRVFVMA